MFIRSSYSEVSSLFLLHLDGTEECLEVSSSETLVTSSLDNLNKESWSVLKWLGEDLEEVALLIKINKDVQLLDHVEVFCDLWSSLDQALSEIVVVGWWDGEENATSLLHVGDGVQDALGSKCDMLDSCSSVEVAVLLDL